MNASILKQKFDESVEYANASEYPILISSKFGKISPNGIVYCKQSDTRDIMFNTDSEYQFIRWHVINKKTGREIENQDYINFDNEYDSNTSFTFEKSNPEIDFMVEPYCELRPRIVSATPSYEPDGVYRDRKIIIMFDEKMSESSIIFTKDELVKLGILSEHEDINSSPLDSGYELLFNSSDRCYGYKKSGDDSSIVFKGVKITDRKNKNENYLKYFSAPHFLSDDTSVLRIDVLKDNPPPSATDILVTITKEMNCDKDTNVFISSDYAWTYYTNGKIDDMAPEFVDFTVQFANDNQSSYEAGNAKLNSENLFFYNANIYFDYAVSNFQKNNLRNKQIWVKGGFSDGGSGPASLKWSLRTANSKYYSQDPGLEIMHGQIDDIEIFGSNATIKNNGIRISLDKIVDEGAYTLIFTCTDKNGNENIREYNFVYDVANTSKIVDYYTGARNQAVEIWFNTEDLLDVAKVKISGDATETINVVNPSSTKIKFNFTDKNVHSFVLRTVDFCGNESTQTLNINEDATVYTGSIVYNPTNKAEDIFCSKKYYNKNPIGVVSDASDVSKIRIWDLWQDDSKRMMGPWTYNMPFEFGDEHGHKTTLDDGLITYNNIMECDGTKNNIITTDISSNTQYIYAYLKNTKNINSPVTWYLPSIREADNLRKTPVKKSMKASFELLNKNNIPCKFVYNENATINNKIVGDECYAAMVWNHNLYGYIWYTASTHPDSYSSDWENHGLDAFHPTNYFIIYNRYMCQIDMR